MLSFAWGLGQLTFNCTVDVPGMTFISCTRIYSLQRAADFWLANSPKIMFARNNILFARKENEKSYITYIYINYTVILLLHSKPLKGLNFIKSMWRILQ